jgi:hypothetical protein
MSWTDYEKEYLAKNIAHRSFDEIADHLNRPVDDVINMKENLSPRTYSRSDYYIRDEFVDFDKLVGLIDQDYEYFAAMTGSYEDDIYTDPYEDLAEYDEWNRRREEYDQRMGHIWEANQLEMNRRVYEDEE